MNKLLITVLLYFLVISGYAQTNEFNKIQVGKQFLEYLKDSNKKKILNNLDTLFIQIANKNIDNEIIQDEHRELTIAVLMGLQGIDSFKNDSENLNNYSKQLVKFYNVSENVYSISIALLSTNSNSSSLQSVFRLIAKIKAGKVKFSIPLQQLTKKWKSTKVGNITYYYEDSFQIKRAQKFNNKNTIISKKLNLTADHFKFYMCKDYQEILNLLGYTQLLKSATTYRLGYGVEKGYIFSIMNNEDFSHDIFHHYSEKIHISEQRNWIAEEGIACSWGNAYYTDKDGEMIENNKLLKELKKYLKDNKEVALFTLFKNNTKIYNHIAPELSVRSIISSIICDEIENKKGFKGISKIITAGRKPNSIDAFLKVSNQLIGINQKNFNKKVLKLLNEY